MSADTTPGSPPPRERRAWRWILRAVLIAPWIVILAMTAYLARRFLPDVPVTHEDIEQHFKYGSTGGERESGFPYWIWQALPQVCAKHLPGQGYASLGFIYEGAADLPVGVSKRRHMGIDRVFLNCAVCHTSTVRDSPNAPPRIYTAMPAHAFDLFGFERFFFDCAADERFRAEFIVPEIERLAGKLSLLDRYLVYPVAVALMRERVLMLRGRFGFMLDQPEWGPGRVDTFNSAKVLFNFPMRELPEHELLAPSDFPSIWNQGLRKTRDDGQPMQLHWDGNNTAVEERNKSAAFGTGTTPPTIDLDAIGRIESWLGGLKPPPYPYPIDQALAERGAPIYKEYCASCHGTSGEDFKGDQVGHVTPIEAIGTDRARLDSYTYDLAVNQATLYAGYPHRFQYFRKTFGYANMPLDGLWLRAPYLHNGSVPTLRDLLEPAAKRPKSFYRGNDVYDPRNVGFVSDVAEARNRKLFRYEAEVPGNSNAGHEGREYGTELPEAEKDSLIEYLKTF